VAVVRSGTLLAGRNEVGIDELLNFDIIGLTEGASISVTLGKLAAERHRALSMRIRVGSFDSMIAMVAAGIGVGVMPEGIATTLAKLPDLVQVKIVEPWAQRRFLMSRQLDIDLSGAAQTIFDFLGA
jgi:DNA-binding transcriptional LysR family regulator